MRSDVNDALLLVLLQRFCAHSAFCERSVYDSEFGWGLLGRPPGGLLEACWAPLEVFWGVLGQT